MQNSQRILVHDLVIPYSGAWSYVKAFNSAGHTADWVSYRAGIEYYFTNFTGKLTKRLLKDIPESARRVHYKQLFSKIEQFRPTIFITTGGHFLGRDFILELRDRGIYAVNLNHDDFFSAFRTNWTTTQRGAIAAYNQILTTREINVGEIQPINPNVEFFPFAFDRDVHRHVNVPKNEESKWKSDVVFVGQWAKHRAAMMTELVTRVKANYKIFGPSWEYLPLRSPLKKLVYNKHIWGDDMAKAIGASKLALGFLRKENRDEYTQRSFEIPACGGVLLGERTPTHSKLFQEGVNAEFFDSDSVEELVQKVTRLLADDTLRERIRCAGVQWIHESSHTYDHRIARILELHREFLNRK